MATSSKTTKISDAERALFLDAVEGARRLQHDRVSLEQPKRAAKRPLRNDPLAQSAQLISIHDAAFPEDLPQQEFLAYQTDGLQRSVLRKLRRGQLPPSTRIDLHGKTVEQAKLILAQVLENSDRYGQNLLIVHGRGLSSPQGEAILKRRVAYWLRQHPNVLAYCSAQPQDGGTGAVYVLLRK